jgi:hypothetical protein
MQHFPQFPTIFQENGEFAFFEFWTMAPLRPVDQPKMARWGMSSIVVLLPEELSTRYNGCPLKMIGHRPEISLIRGNGWSGRKHLQRKRIKL